MREHWTNRRRGVAFGVGLSLLVVVGLPFSRVAEELEAASGVAVASPCFAPRLVSPSLPAKALPPGLPVALTLRSGQALGSLLDELGLPPADRAGVVAALSDHVEVRRLRPGLEVRAFVEAGATPDEIAVTLEGEGRVFVGSTGDEWVSRFSPFERRAEARMARGTITSSLVGALAEAGAPEMVAYRMAEVLQWDVDFNRDLRRGDRFDVVFEEISLDGVPHGVGDVLTVHFENAGRRLEAYRFGDGYYDEEGRPLEKMFLRSPLPFSRITSRFSRRRFHPVLKEYRPHYGVDYGAPTGTPVRSTASGVVTFAGWDRGGGNTIKIRHPNDYLTAYLHLSRFASGVGPGRRVAQGDVIGYVGATGLATGSHLDYRVRHRGRWIDPLTIESVPAEPIERSRLAEFLAWRDELRSRLAAASVEELEAVETEVASTGAVGTVPARLGR